MRISDWSSDVCSSDLAAAALETVGLIAEAVQILENHPLIGRSAEQELRELAISRGKSGYVALYSDELEQRSEEHTSELQSLMRISYAVFCLKKKNRTL